MVIIFTSYLVRYSDLARMYSLVSLVPDGMEKLRALFQDHVYEQGLSLLEKCKDTAINVILTTCNRQ